MSNYVKATNFTAKDSLPSGNPSKIVKGAEIDTEFTAIASAVASKADLNSPALTGTPTAPTATVGTNTTQLATTAFVKGEITALGLGNMSTQNKTAVDITGGTITGVTISGLAADLAVADGGTGAGTFTLNSVVLGNGTSSLAGNMVAPGASGNVLKSNGTTWQSATLKGIGLGGEVWNNVTSSRSLGVTYTNSNSYPIMISVNGTGSGTSGIYVFVNDTIIYFNQAQWNGAGAYPAAAIIVPPGATYKVTMTSSGLSTWWELY